MGTHMEGVCVPVRIKPNFRILFIQNEIIFSQNSFSVQTQMPRFSH